MPASSSNESYNQRLKRVRRPRVHIIYEVETEGMPEKVELPFVVGILADLSGTPAEPLKPLVERKFVPIDRDNLNDVMARAAPRLALRVPDKLTGENNVMSVELNFRNMDDFEPANVARQVPALKELLEMRQQLVRVLSKADGRQKVENLLEELLRNTEKRAAVARELGIEPQTENQAPQTEESK